MPGTVVNGGLIDFQDNLHRGVQEYVTPAMLLQANGASNPQGMMALGGQAAFVQQGAAFPLNGNAQAGILCGPASYLHVNGVTYKPVEEPNSKLSTQDPASFKQTQSSSGDAGEAGTRMLSKRELQQAIDDRVKSQVRSYIRHQQGDLDDYPGGGARVSSDACFSPEELAARRVADLNAGMTARSRGKPIQSGW